MLNQQIFDYINKQKQAGANQADIKKALLSVGWKEADIDEAFNQIAQDSFARATGVNPRFTPPAAPTQTLPGPIEILSEAWDIFTKKFLTLIGINLIPVLSALVFVGIIALIIMNNDFRPNFSQTPTAIFLSAGITGIVGLILFIAIAMWAQVAMICALKYRQENIGIKESFLRARAKISNYILVISLVGLLTLGATFLFAVPGIIFSIWFSLAIYVCIDEDLKGMNALLKSKFYVQGRWWQVLFYPLIFYILFAILGFIATMIFAPIAGELYGDIIIRIISYILGPLFYVFLYLFYEKLKASKSDADFNPTQKEKNTIFIVSGLGYVILALIITFLIKIFLPILRNYYGR